MNHPLVTRGLVLASLLFGFACGDDQAPAEAKWAFTLLESERSGALLSVWGTRHDDVWIVGGDQGGGLGPTVLHYDGHESTALETGESAGNLWWVTGAANADGPVFMGGDDGLILRHDYGRFERMATPSTGTVYGLWAASPDDVWAVGGGGATDAFVWRLQAGGPWQAAEGFAETGLAETRSLRKVWGTSPSDVWMVGTAGTTVHYDGTRFEVMALPGAEELFTVHAAGARIAAVGGIGSGVIYERDAAAGGFRDVAPNAAPELTGIWLRDADHGYAVGGAGVVYARDTQGWHALDTGSLVTEDLHSVWVDERGCLFSAGGRWRSYPLTRGLLLHGCDEAQGGEEPP